MQNTYHARLKLPVDFRVNTLTSTDRISQYTATHQDLENLLLAAGVGIREAQRFYTPPNGTLPPHADCDHLNNYTKLNYVFGGQDSQMIWYRLQNGCAAKKMLTSVGTKYLYAPAEDLVPVFSAHVGFPSLVNSGQFHSVLNGAEPRICYSFMLTYAEHPDQNINWCDAVDRLQQYVAD